MSFGFRNLSLTRSVLVNFPWLKAHRVEKDGWTPISLIPSVFIHLITDSRRCYW
jgi:hypothetical protein